jgi:DNA invertase Pin-like site-specific DNA recombinase
MTTPLRAALYLRVSTARQAEHDASIPDQKRQGEAYCASRGYELVETYVEPGASATNDRRREFQRMIEAGSSKPAPFDIVLVHSFSRFFRDHFELEFHVRKLAKNGIKLVSITQEIGDDPMHVMMRQMMALFDEYQSKESGKHTLRAMRENARQGFWNDFPPADRLPRRRRRAARREDQEAARNRSAPRGHGAADLSPSPRRRRHNRPDGREGDRKLPERAPNLHSCRWTLGHRSASSDRKAICCTHSQPHPAHGRPRLQFAVLFRNGVPYRIRTGVAAVRGRCPGPLDEGDEASAVR